MDINEKVSYQIQDAVSEAQAAGWTPQQTRREVRMSWLYLMDRDYKAAVKEVERAL